MTSTILLDVKGLGCPLPILRANRAIKELIIGDILEIMCTDKGAPEDFQIFCETTGHRFIESLEEDGIFTIRLEVLV